MILHWNDESIPCSKVVRYPESIEVYDENDILIQRIDSISIVEWDHITLEYGDWSDPADIPSETEKIKADLDYCLMLLEDL